MKKTITMLILAALSTTLAASAATRTLNPGKINKVSVSTGVELHYTKGTTTQVRMEAENDIFSEVEVSTEGGLLSINNNARTYENRNSNSVPLKVWVTAPEINSFKATVGSSINIENSSYTITGPLNIDITVGSKFKANTLSAASVNLINSVGSNTDISMLESKGNMSIQNTTGTIMEINTIKAGGTLTFKSGPSSKTDLYNVKAETSTFSFGPTDRFTISQKIDAKSIAVYGSVNANINLSGIDTDLLDVKGTDYGCDIQLAGKADKLIGTSNGTINTTKLYAKSTDLRKVNEYESYYYGRAFKDSERANSDIERANREYERSQREYERSQREYERSQREYERSQRDYQRTQKASERAQQKQSNSYNYNYNNYNTVGNAQSSTKERSSATLTTGTIKKVEATRSLAIYYTQGPLKPVKILTPAGREKDIKVYMDGTTLKVRVYGYADYSVNRNTNTTDFGFQVFVQAPDVESFELSSGAGMRFNNSYTSKGNLSIEAGSGCSIAVEDISVANLSLDLSAGASIRAKDLEADNITFDQSAGSTINGLNVEANNRLTVDVSGGGWFHVESVKAPQCNIDLSAGSSFQSNRVTSSEINIDASASANATLASINATNINVDASAVSTVTLSGKCDNLNIIDGYISNSYNNYYNNSYGNNYNSGRIIINGLKVANRTTTSEGSNSTSEYNYYDDSKSYTPKTEKEKATEAIKVLRSIGLDDEAIRMTLKSSGISSDVIDSLLKNTPEGTKKAKKEYTEDNLVP